MLYNIDPHNLEYICYLYITNDIFHNLYTNIGKLYYSSKLLQHTINTILIEDYNIILDVIIYLKLYNPINNPTNKPCNYNNVFIYNNLYDTYLNTIYEKWQSFNEYRLNIYQYINDIIYIKNLNLYKNNGVKYITDFNINKLYIPNSYKDSKKFINNIDMAYLCITQNENITYTTNISKELKDLNNPIHFELLCYAIKQHVTVIKNISKYNFTINQIINLLHHNISVYKYLPKSILSNINILEHIILYTDEPDKIKLYKLDSEKLEHILNINTKYNFNLQHNTDCNKKYISFILYYISKFHSHINIIKKKLYNNNKLFSICYDKLYIYIINGYIYSNYIYQYTLKLNKNMYTINIPINYNKLNINIANSFKNILGQSATTFNVILLYNKLCSSDGIEVQNKVYTIHYLNEDWLNILKYPDINKIYISDLFHILLTYFPEYIKIEFTSKYINNLLQFTKN